MVLEVSGRHFLFLAFGLGQPNAGKADRDATKHSEHGHRSGRADPAPILVQGNIQSLMPGFDPPIPPATAQQIPGRPLLGIGTGDDGPGLGLEFSLLLLSGALQFPDLTRRHKTHLLRRGLLEAQRASFLPAAIGLHRLGLARRIPRGKKRPL